MPPDSSQASLANVVTRLSPLLRSQAKPLALVHTEGTLPGHGIRDLSIEAEKQLTVMRDAALAWRAGAGEGYFALADRYLLAWIGMWQPNYDPIDETHFDALIETFAILSPSLDARSRAKVREFLIAWAKGYVALMDRNATASSSTQVNRWNSNWQSHRIKLVTMIAVALDDAALLDDARRFFRTQLDHNLKADGEVLDFGERDALHYVIYDLEPLIEAALAMRTRGEDWFHQRGAAGQSIAGAVAWLIPYAQGNKRHVEFARSSIAFDRKRAEAGEKGYSGPFDPSAAGDLLWAASRFDASYLDLARSLKPTPPTAISMCGV